jgi:hypothetical protein
MSVDGHCMVNGINENVETYGRMFHVQTEVTTGAQPMVRSTVYLDGTIVGAREVPVDPQNTSEKGIHEQMNSQHKLIIANLATRAVEYEAQAPRPDVPEAPFRTSQRSDLSKLKEIPRPELDGDPELAEAVMVRQLLGPFSLALRPSPYQDPESVRTRLETAARMIDDIMAAPAFSEIRLDEQVRFFDLRERLAAWRGAGRDPESAAEILLAMVVFAGHLRRISDRRELVVFDHKLLTWALSRIGRDGVTEEALGHLKALCGRDAELDRLLAQQAPIEANRLLEVLLALLDRTLPGEY